MTTIQSGTLLPLVAFLIGLLVGFTLGGVGQILAVELPLVKRGEK